MGDHNSRQPNIVAENVQIRYTVGTSDPTSRSKGVQRIGDRLLGRQGRTTVRALRGVSLVAYEGEMVGIVGANGSGKSTFLRTVAGVEQPDRGRILARYQPVLLGVHASLQQNLSGSENVRLGCLAMGLTPDEVEGAYEYVTELSALGSAIHRPMGTYSSGMSSRLRFAIALAARPRILLIDEALSTGDATFSERSSTAMNGMLEEAGTVFLVNHAAKVIQEMCSRAVWMHRGEKIMDGPAEAVAERYRWWAWNVAKDKPEVADKLLEDVLKSAKADQINILEPELTADPIPRHALRRKKRKREELSQHTDRDFGAIHETTGSGSAPSDTSAPNEDYFVDAGAKHRKIGSPFPEMSGAPALQTRPDANEPPPLSFRRLDKPVILRPEDPRDSAIAIADMTRRRMRAGKSSQSHGAQSHSSRNGDSHED